MDNRCVKLMFIGEFQHSVDAKGRLALPARFRSLLEKGCVVTRGTDACLDVYPRDAWQKIAEKIAALPASQANARTYARLKLAGAVDVEPDKQGRVLVPDFLRKYAGIGKEAVVAGLFDHLEIWDRDAWEKSRKNAEASASQIAEHLGV